MGTLESEAVHRCATWDTYGACGNRENDAGTIWSDAVDVWAGICGGNSWCGDGTKDVGC